MLVALALMISAAPPTEERRVAITSLAGLGLNNDLVVAFERYLETSIGTIEGVSTISSIEVDIALDDPKNAALRDCGGRERVRCAARIGRILGADAVVYGTIGAIGNSYSLNLRAVDVSSEREVAKHSTTIAGSRDQLIPEVRLAAFKLMAPEKILGTLKVGIGVVGVSVEIDGRAIGTTPLPEPTVALPPGPHVLVLRRPGFDELQREFEIRAFETTTLEVALELLERD